MDTREIINRNLRGMLVSGKSYPSPLPPELETWYAYTLDGGHSIVCLLETHAGEAFASHAERDYLVPAPVRAVLRAGYRVSRGYVVVDLPYDDKLGLMTEPEDDEY
jgi:hypothetical protein